LWPFGLLFPSLVCFTKKNLSTQLQTICLWISSGACARIIICFASTRLADQDCQMSYFLTKNPNSVIFRKTWNGTFWYILWTFGIFLIVCKIYLPFGTYILCSFGISFYQFWCVEPTKIWQPCCWLGEAKVIWPLKGNGPSGYANVDMPHSKTLLLT
jgi:hypothetical protein